MPQAHVFLENIACLVYVFCKQDELVQKEITINNNNNSMCMWGCWCPF